jgi:hypothetical protein
VTLTSAGAAAAAEDGSYPIVPSAAVGTGLSNYSITYVPGTLTVLEPAITVASAPLAAIHEGDASDTVEVATFTHAAGIESASHFSATVDWGVAGHQADAGTISEDGGGTYHVMALRPVLSAGSYTATVKIGDNDGGANIEQNFAGLTANNGYPFFGGFFFPPDQASAVGPHHYVEMVNLLYAIYNKDGSVAVPATSLATFYANAGVSIPFNSSGNPFLTDPRIVYDQASGRWFALIITTESNSNSIVVAVSQTSDPTGAWKAARFVGNKLANNFADYPTIAIDQNALYIATNNFLNNASFDGVSLTSIPKSDLLNPAGPVVSNRTLVIDNSVGGATPGTTPFTLAPVSDFAGRDHGVILSADRFPQATVLHRYSVLNPGATGPTVTADNPITVASYWAPQSAHQPDGTLTLDATDARFGQNNVYQVGNVIWAANSIRTNASFGPGAYDAIRWYEIDETTNTVLQSGTISDPHHDFNDPAIAANAAGNVVIGFSATGDSTTSDYPGAWYVAGTTTGGVTTFGTPTVLRNGSSNYSIVGSGNRNRWGDYSAISIDPNNPNAFWIADEAAVPGDPNVTTRTQLWGTQISEFVFGNTVSVAGTLTVNNVAPNVKITAPGLSEQAFAINTPVAFGGSFTDPGSNLGESYTATWSFDAGTQPGTVSGSTVTTSHTFTVPGVYDVILTVTDSNGASGSASTDVNGTPMTVVIFDPSSGSVTGGGEISVGTGSLGNGSTVAGQANFGLVSQYKKGASVPTGETEFQFQAGNINFHSTGYDWLTVNAVVNDSWSQYQGTGTINNLSPANTADVYKFYVATEDNQWNGGAGVDKLRMKIWEQNATTGAVVKVIFDNQWGAADTAGEPGILPFVDLTTPLIGGAINLHKLNGAQVDGPVLASTIAPPSLTQQEVGPIVQRAIAAWSAAGITAAQINMLGNVPVYITDLPGDFVGMSSPDGIWIDKNGAGLGWFVDSMQTGNNAFSIRLASNKLAATPGSPAYGRMDLFTILVHEMGRPLGLQELPDASGVMAMKFQSGVRELPVATDLIAPRRQKSAGDVGMFDPTTLPTSNFLALSTQITAPAVGSLPISPLTGHGATQQASRGPLAARSESSVVKKRQLLSALDQLFAGGILEGFKAFWDVQT